MQVYWQYETKAADGFSYQGLEGISETVVEDFLRRCAVCNARKPLKAAPRPVMAIRTYKLRDRWQASKSQGVCV
jgi:hypothetical protein